MLHLLTAKNVWFFLDLIFLSQMSFPSINDPSQLYRPEAKHVDAFRNHVSTHTLYPLLLKSSFEKYRLDL